MDFGVGEWYRISVRVLDWDRNRTPRAIALSKWTDYYFDEHTSDICADGGKQWPIAV